MPFGQTQEPLVIAARSISATGTTQSPSFGVDPAVDWVAIQLNCTANGGTSPNVTVTVQWSMDGGTTWSDADATAADAFTALTLSGQVFIKRFNIKAPLLRLKEVTTGTSPTLSYTATAYYR